MNEATKKKIEELEAQLTPRGAYEAIRWGRDLPEGRRFCDIYSQIAELDPAVKAYLASRDKNLPRTR